MEINFENCKRMSLKKFSGYPLYFGLKFNLRTKNLRALFQKCFLMKNYGFNFIGDSLGFYV
jgi:hypothetical protein